MSGGSSGLGSLKRSPGLCACPGRFLDGDAHETAKSNVGRSEISQVSFQDARGSGQGGYKAFVMIRVHGQKAQRAAKVRRSLVASS